MAETIQAGILALFIVAGLGILVGLSVRRQKRQRLQFKATAASLYVMRATRDKSPVEAEPSELESIIESAAGHTSGTNLRDLLGECHKRAAEIDRYTGRKHAAERVALLVFKASCQMGNDREQALLHCAIGLVYDIGFLELPSALFKAARFNEDQFEIMRNHPIAGLKNLNFVPPQYLDAFQAGVAMHHENMDGSGYPARLKGDEIPWIARALRVCETYTALVTSRSYNRLMDHAEAIGELRKHKQQFDPTLIAVMDLVSGN